MSSQASPHGVPAAREGSECPFPEGLTVVSWPAQSSSSVIKDPLVPGDNPTGRALPAGLSPEEGKIRGPRRSCPRKESAARLKPPSALALSGTYDMASAGPLTLAPSRTCSLCPALWAESLSSHAAGRVPVVGALGSAWAFPQRFPGVWDITETPCPTLR